jgi:chorismate mutase
VRRGYGMFSVRGAITVEIDSANEILESTKELLERIIVANSIKIEEIISIIFSCTRDIKSTYPAEAARNIGILSAGLLCLQEMYVEKSMEKCIRILMLVNGERSQKSINHIFLREAIKLRPDIMQDFDKIY